MTPAGVVPPLQSLAELNQVNVTFPVGAPNGGTAPIAGAAREAGGASPIGGAAPRRSLATDADPHRACSGLWRARSSTSSAAGAVGVACSPAGRRDRHWSLRDLTTTNREALNQFIESAEALEIIGKPYDLDQVLLAVRRVLPSI